MNLEEGEPMGYLEFGTDKKINFQRFETTSKFKSLVSDSILVRNKAFAPSLLKRYRIFDRSPIKKILLKEIKDNLL